MLLPHRVEEIPTAGNICYFGAVTGMSPILSALVTSEGKGRGYAESKAGWEAPRQSSQEDTGAFCCSPRWEFGANPS